jgi:hypothetical protein
MQSLVKAQNNDFSIVNKVWASYLENILRPNITIEIRLNIYVY